MTFPVWAVATAHGLLAGTDRHELWFLLLMMTAVAGVAAAASARFEPLAPERAIGWAVADASVHRIRGVTRHVRACSRRNIDAH
jgi:hypothetical protein